MNFLLLAALLPTLFWDKAPDTADQLRKSGITVIAVPAANEPAWRSQPGLTVRAENFDGVIKLITPGVAYRANEASATRSPWVSQNGWQYLRNPKGRFHLSANGPASALAAAEAFLYGGNAVVQTDAAGLDPLGQMLAFLSQVTPSDMPPLADIGFIDDGSAEAAEAMNLMARKNLMFRIVAKPDPKLTLNVPFGSAKYPKSEAANPAAFAQKIRGDLTDERRSFRIYGSEIVLGRLQSDGQRLRVHLLNYAGAARPVPGIRVRVRGHFTKHEIKAAGAPGIALQELHAGTEFTEFTIPEMKTYAVVDLMR